MMPNRSLSILCYGLSLTNLFWAVSLLVDPGQYVGKPIIPVAFALIHIAIGLAMISRYRVYGGWLSLAVLTYYWLFVKPREPIAEPQSVGILVISIILVLPHLQRLLSNRIPADFPPLAVRLGLAYPFFEWGLDVLRNPNHFQSYLAANQLTQPIMQTWGAENVILLLGVFEVVLALILALGFMSRAVALVCLGTLIIFAIVAGYPLALPQDIALGAASVFLFREGSGSFSLDKVLSRT